MMKWNGIPVHKVKDIEERFQHIGDSGEAVSGDLLVSHIGVKREWQVETAAITPSEYSPLITELHSTGWALGNFWIDDFGTEDNVVLSRIDPTTFRAQVVQQGRNGTWHRYMRKLRFTVREA